MKHLSTQKKWKQVKKISAVIFLCKSVIKKLKSNYSSNQSKKLSNIVKVFANIVII